MITNVAPLPSLKPLLLTDPWYVKCQMACVRIQHCHKGKQKKQKNNLKLLHVLQLKTFANINMYKYDQV